MQTVSVLSWKFAPKGGTSSNRKRKLNNPEAISVCSNAGNLLYSIKVRDRDDRSFCSVAGSSWLCYFNSCHNIHASAVASGQEQLNKFPCPHLEKVKDSMSSREEHHLNSEKLAEYSPLKHTVQFQHLLLQEHLPKNSIRPPTIHITFLYVVSAARSADSHPLCGMDGG